MIQGPLSGNRSSDGASAEDVTALTGVVATNTSELVTAQGTISTHTGQITSINNSYNNLGNSFYTKALTDGLLTAKQNVVGAAGLDIDRIALLQATLDSRE